MREHLLLRGKKSLIHFSHWTRKPYAVFNSLRKEIKISCLAVALINFSFLTKVEAQQDTSRQKEINYELEEIEVIGQKAPALYSELSRVVTIISRKEIESSPAQSLQDVLQFVHSSDLRQRGTGDVQADINMRSGGFDQTLILLNGIAINDPQTGHHSLDLPISLDQIERIEILAGPGSRVLGPNAYSGAINIITKKAENNFIQLNALLGDFGLLNSSTSVGLKGKKLTNYVSAGHSQSSGYTSNTDFDKTNLFYFGEFTKNKHQFSWQTSASSKKFGANSFYTAKYPNQFEETQTGFVSFLHQYSGKITSKSSAFFRGHTDRFELFRDMKNAPLWYKNHNYHFSQSAGFNTVAFYVSTYGKTAIGADFRHENIQSNVLGLKLKDTLDAFLDMDGFYTKYDYRNYISIYAEHNFRVKKFVFSGGLMFYKNSTSPKSFVFPGLDISWEVSKNLKVYSSLNTSMRQPTFTDLYYQGPTNIGNPNLNPETARSVEIGGKFQRKSIRANISLYYSEGENTIDWVRMNITDKWQAQNITHLNSFGTEIQLLYKPSKPVLKVLKSMEISYSQNKIDKSSGQLQSYYIMDYLKFKCIVKAEFAIYKNFGGSLNYRYQDRNGSFLLYDISNNTETEKEYQEFSTSDLKLYYQKPNWKIYIQIANIFDNKYYDYGNIIQSGRWLSIGGNYRFDLSK